MRDISAAALSPSGRNVLVSNRGAGFWLWKPYIIWKCLLDARDGDIIFYADAGTEFISDVTPLLNLTLVQDVVGFSLHHPESTWTKYDTFVILGAEHLNQTTQMLATFVLVRKSLVSLNFVSRWLSYAQDPRVISDSANTLGRNFEGFKDHRHDQSIFSLLYKLHDFVVFEDPSQWGNHNKSRPYPQIINHTRIKD